MTDKISRDEIQALAETRFGVGETPDEASFQLLVAVAAHVYEQYLEQDKPNIEDPASFTPSTMLGVPHGWALIEGLIENLEMQYSDGEFRRMMPGESKSDDTPWQCGLCGDEISDASQPTHACCGCGWRDRSKDGTQWVCPNCNKSDDAWQGKSS